MQTWRERIHAARERGYFTEGDVIDATASWSTCAVGEVHSRYGDEIIHYRQGVSPSDHELIRLGSSGGGTHGFGWAVALQHMDRAEQLLDLIEDRALELKRAYTPEMPR
jgi:hypothetical protein